MIQAFQETHDQVDSPVEILAVHDAFVGVGVAHRHGELQVQGFSNAMPSSTQIEKDAIEQAINGEIEKLMVSQGHLPRDTDNWSCSTENLRSVDNRVGDLFVKRFRSLETMSRLKLLGLQASVARDTFKYALSPTFTAQKDPHTSYSVNAAYGQEAGWFNLAQASYRYESSYKGADKSNVCSPISASTSSVCQETATKAPSHNIKSVIQIDGRKFFRTHFAIDPTIAGDLRARAALLSLPIYLFKAKDGGLNGGFTVAWRSDTHEWTGSVSVGQVFGLITPR